MRFEISICHVCEELSAIAHAHVVDYGAPLKADSSWVLITRNNVKFEQESAESNIKPFPTAASISFIVHLVFEWACWVEACNGAKSNEAVYVHAPLVAVYYCTLSLAKITIGMLSNGGVDGPKLASSYKPLPRGQASKKEVMLQSDFILGHAHSYIYRPQWISSCYDRERYIKYQTQNIDSLAMETAIRSLFVDRTATKGWARWILPSSFWPLKQMVRSSRGVISDEM